jgi:hypothetical protein
MFAKLRHRLRVVTARLQPLQRVISNKPAADARLCVRDQIVNPRYLLIERARCDDAEGPRDLDRVVNFTPR